MFNFSPENFEYNECVARGSCSIPPKIFALQEVMFFILRQTSFYILKLKTLNSDTSKYDIKIIENLSYLISGTEFSDTQLLNRVLVTYSDFLKVKNEYICACKAQNIKSIELKNQLVLFPDMSLSKIISVGENLFKEKYKKLTSENKYYIDLIHLLLKNLSISLLHLSEYISLSEKYINIFLNSLNLENLEKVSKRKYYNSVLELAKTNSNALKTLSALIEKQFGTSSETEVSHSTSKGKSILVSGTNMQDLENLLKFCQDKPIDIYTHDSLITAHTYSEFKKYKNLKGHFGICYENCVLDFATFPGAILLTGSPVISTEYLYRGRLFTTSDIIPKGVTQIKDGDFQPLIESALNAKGFAKGQIRPSEIVGLNFKNTEKVFMELSKKVADGNISKILIWGVSKQNQDIFEKLISDIPDTTFVISFSYDTQKHKNFLRINVDSDRVLISRVIELLAKYIPLTRNTIDFYFAKCEGETLSDMLYLKSLGVENLYMTNCTSASINPGLKAFILKEFHISNLS